MINIEKEDRHKIISDSLKKIYFYKNKKEIQYKLVPKPIFRISSKNRFISICLEIIRIILQLTLIIYHQIFSKNKLIILREFNSCIILFLIFFPRNFKSNLILFINHNITTPPEFIKKLILNNKLSGLKYLIYDGHNTKSLFNKKENIFTPLFPLNLNKNKINRTVKLLKSKFSKKYTVGISLSLNKKSHSKVSKEKLTLISKLIEEKIYLKIFSRDPSRIKRLLPKSLFLEILDTSTKEKYTKAIAETTLFIIFEANIETTYQYRHSGSIIELINNACIPIIPNLPILNSQIKNPCEIGLVYNINSDLKDIDKIIKNKIKLLKNNEKKFINNLEEYLTERSKDIKIPL